VSITNAGPGPARTDPDKPAWSYRVTAADDPDAILLFGLWETRASARTFARWIAARARREQPYHATRPLTVTVWRPRPLERAGERLPAPDDAPTFPFADDDPGPLPPCLHDHTGRCLGCLV